MNESFSGHYLLFSTRLHFKCQPLLFYRSKWNGSEIEYCFPILLHLGQTPWPKLLKQCLIELAAGPSNLTQRAGGENEDTVCASAC